MREFRQFSDKNLSIGLFGGSFDPPHEGHLKIAKDALSRFELDWVWWFVTPQNTLKSVSPQPLAERIKLCQKMLIKEHKMLVSDLESLLNFQDTIQLVTFLQNHCPNKYFWIAGSDTLQDILGRIKMIVYDRPGWLFKDIKHQITQDLLSKQIDVNEFIKAETLPPAWTLVLEQALNISSTQIRSERC